ncbi:hypothetical protein T07_2067 [Trichinella nelsoni]|uniref:FLYWCH-type domain-containing protein n=1 Tax=Trichinella nelsoni TaxID=6336 RepID=A0A0V0S6T8_9BILA|nr:hypothetical protein T07_2067 [Trichinella nelsoni]
MLIWCHHPMTRWSGIFTMLRMLCQIKSFSDPCSEPLLVRNYCARRTIGTKAWEANKIQIYPLCLPSRIISNDYIIYRAYAGLKQRRIMHICHRENLNKILMNCFFLLIQVHEGRVYNLKHTNMQDKLWVCRRVKKGCRGSIFTNLDEDAVLDCNSHADDCTPDNDILHKMEKKNSLKRRAAEELKTIPQIYHEEASSASADLETAGQFPTYKSVKTAMYRKRAQRFPRLPLTCR